jgi:hypothetical protein
VDVSLLARLEPVFKPATSLRRFPEAAVAELSGKGVSYSQRCKFLFPFDVVGIVSCLLSPAPDGPKLINRGYSSILSLRRRTNNAAGTGLTIDFG